MKAKVIKMLLGWMQEMVKKFTKNGLPIIVVAIILIGLLTSTGVVYYSPQITFEGIGFEGPKGYNAVFTKTVANDMTKEDVEAFFGNTVPSLEKDGNENYVDGRAYIHEAISNQFYYAVTGKSHFTGEVTLGGIDWVSADGINKAYEDYTKILKEQSFKGKNVQINGNVSEVYNDNMRWDKNNLITYPGKATTGYNEYFWINKEYSDVFLDICKTKLSASEIEEIMGVKEGKMPANYNNICKKVGEVIKNLQPNEVFSDGEFMEDIIDNGNNNYTVNVTDYYIPFILKYYKTGLVTEVEYKTVGDEDMFNLIVSLWQNIDAKTFEKENEESNSILDFLYRFARAMLRQKFGLITYRGVPNVGSKDNDISPAFNLEAFDDWYKGNNGYTKGYAEFINVKNPAVMGVATGNSVQDYIYTTLRNQANCNHATACGFMGNINNESGWNPASDDSPPNGPYGLCQWLNGGGSTRRSQLEQLAAQNGKPASDVSVQAEFIAYDLNTGHKENVDVCNSQYPNADDCAVYMMCKYYAAPSWPVEKTMVAYTQSGRQIDTHSFHFTGAQNGAGHQNFKTEERIAEALKFDEMYKAYENVPNGQVVIATGNGEGKAGVADYAVAQIGKEYDQSRRMDENVFDCSSLVARAYQSVGFDGFMNSNYAMTTHTEWQVCEQNGWLIPYNENYVPEVGDIFFFGDSYGAGACSHVGLYVGERGGFNFVHAKGKAYGVVACDYTYRKPQAVGRPQI